MSDFIVPGSLVLIIIAILVRCIWPGFHGNDPNLFKYCRLRKHQWGPLGSEVSTPYLIYQGAYSRAGHAVTTARFRTCVRCPKTTPQSSIPGDWEPWMFDRVERRDSW